MHWHEWFTVHGWMWMVWLLTLLAALILIVRLVRAIRARVDPSRGGSPEKAREQRHQRPLKQLRR